MSAKKFKFGPWIPDQPDLDNPGLIEALNVRPVGDASSGYEPYLPLVTVANAFTSAGGAAKALLVNTGNNIPWVYVSTADSPPHLYRAQANTSSTVTWTDYASGSMNAIQDIAQYNNLVIAADGLGASGHGLWQHDSTAPATVALISGSPIAQVLGVIGQFVIAGNIYSSGVQYPHRLQWSGINQPTSFPTPNSATAIAQQSGQQDLHEEFGAVTGIFGGDQWGIILQSDAITRATYVGGSTVFQFDTLSAGIGMDVRYLAVKIGGKVYFACSRGFYATDGVSLDPIGEEIVNRWFMSTIVGAGIIGTGTAAVDWSNKLIMWTFAGGGANKPAVFYNFETKRFTHSTDTNLAVVVTGNVSSFYGTTPPLQGIGLDNKLGVFTGSAGTATIVTPEVELNPGGHALVQGFRPQIQQQGAATVTCKIGSRMKQDTNIITYTSAITVNSQTGFADALVEAVYHRVEIDIAGQFNAALGGEFKAVPAGDF